MNRIATVTVFSLLGALCSSAQKTIPLTLQRTITLTGVAGKFDHFAIDVKGNRLFTAATGNKSVEVIDLSTDQSVQSVSGLGKPHGLIWIPATGRLFVADGDRAELDVFEGSPLKKVRSIKLSEDADDMAYDSRSNPIYVGNGGKDAANPAAIAVVDANSLALVTQLAVAAHPEAIEVDEVGHRIFANISDTGEVVIIDGKTRALSSTWPLNGEKGNTPLAYDAAGNAGKGVLLVGCRTPAKLLALSGKTGKEISSAPSDTGADDLFYDASTHRAYLITGSGSVNSYSVSPDGKLRQLANLQTVAGAKTGLFVPSRRRLYVGVPGTGGAAEVRVYKTDDK